MDFLSGIGSILGGLFGGMGGKDSTQEFEKHSTVNSSASATDLSPELLKSLETLFQSTVKGGGFKKSGDAITGRLNQLISQAKRPEFDVAGFAKGITDQATSAAGLQLESDINGLLSQSGTTESGNSMSQLIANKLRNQTAANLSGISAQATGVGEGLRQSQQGQLTEGIGTLSTSLSDQILKLIQSTRGASTSGTSTSKEDTKGKGTASESGDPFSALGGLFSSMGKARTDA
jgi:hypothetical protein